jgi:hypothetical protein
MNPKLQIISSKELIDKYYESGIQGKLSTFKKIPIESRVLGRRTELYLDHKTKRKMVVLVFDKNGNTEQMCVTWLVDGETTYCADR